MVSMMKNELRPLGRAIVRGPCTPKVSSNATTKTPDLGMYTRVKRKEIFTKSLQFDSVKRPDLKKRRAVIQISDDRRLNLPVNTPGMRRCPNLHMYSYLSLASGLLSQD